MTTQHKDGNETDHTAQNDQFDNKTSVDPEVFAAMRSRLQDTESENQRLLDKFSAIELLRVELDTSMITLQKGYQAVIEERNKAFESIKGLRNDLTENREAFEREKKIHISTREKLEALQSQRSSGEVVLKSAGRTEDEKVLTLLQSQIAKLKDENGKLQEENDKLKATTQDHTNLKQAYEVMTEQYEILRK